ncbi:ribosome biogenesis protein BOP1 homolog [Argentina anserina]|uniref:ribosome biogenesis protein BOP1 homolog n=1 Tax=Argentina anserina TaxID=57926 RepID=UPI0021765A62|nr:ribosome biogenesis protein BOP1 homolog [Potentilla anserina]XP_050375810.1 ribosome biogenesis protein BOP1 homolog [Potentilla anserina]
MKSKNKSSMPIDSAKEEQKKQKGKGKMKVPEGKPERPQPVEEEVDSDSVYDSGAEDEWTQSEEMSGSERSDSEDSPSIRDTDSEDEERGSSKNEIADIWKENEIKDGELNTSRNDGLAIDHGKEEESDSYELHEQVEESDSSEDEVAPRNTIGAVPLEWYQDEKHIGYDNRGKKIKKMGREDKLQSYLASADDSKSWRKFIDDYNAEEVEVTKEDIKTLNRLLEGKAPHGDFDPCLPYVDWFKWDDSLHPLSNAPEPKRRFIPSKSESKLVKRLVLAIRKGLIKPRKDEEEEEETVYPLWGDDSNSMEKDGSHLSYIPAPKPKLPGYEESFNPPPEFIPTKEEIDAYQLMYEEDRPKFIPKRFTSMRSIPAYENAIKECFERCLDLYLCPRVRKKRININPESLKPKLPSRKDLKPYPVKCYLQFRGHKDRVTSVSTEVSGQWIASGSLDGTVRIWEVQTGRCLKIWKIGEAVTYVAWNPNPEYSVLAVSVGHDVLIINTGFGNEEVQEKTKELLSAESPTTPDDTATFVSWIQDETHEGTRLRHFKTVSSVEWHRRGDYFSTVVPTGQSKSIFLHKLSQKSSQPLSIKLGGFAVTSVFHPVRSHIFISTKKTVRQYDLVKGKQIRKLDTGLKEISSIAVHPSGDHVIVGSREGKFCWFDMDLSTKKPYLIRQWHKKDINSVASHRLYPLFATCSDDCTVQVSHGMVYSDLNQDPLIVPLEILRGHASSDGRGVMDCKFHPRQPWLFTAGADSVIRLYCD